MSVGSMKHQYLSGWSMAVHSSGERVTHSLTDIYGEINETWPECDYTEAMS